MTPLVKKVWSLWDSIDEMAATLGESPHVLRRQRDMRLLPDAKHDSAIVIRARYMGRRITAYQLATAREAKPPMALAERSALIRRFYEAAGGYEAVAERTGASRASLYNHPARGFLNRSGRHEYEVLAAEIGFELPPEIYTRPPG